MTATNTWWRAAACLVALAAVLLVSAPVAAAGSARLDRVERKVLKRFNAVRAQAGLRPLRPARPLARAAEAHSRDMLRADFFAHPSSNGQSMQARVASFRPAALLGEVLAYIAGGGGQARAVTGMWMRSAPHRETILVPGFRRVGIARRTGSLGGGKVTVFTVDFASAR